MNKKMNSKSDKKFWLSLCLTLFLFLMAVLALSDLYTALNNNIDATGPLFASLILGFLGYRSGKWFMSFVPENQDPNSSRISNAQMDPAPKIFSGELARFDKEQWNRLLPDIKGYVTGHKYFLEGAQCLDKALSEFFEGGSVNRVKDLLKKTDVALEKLEKVNEKSGGAEEGETSILKDLHKTISDVLSLVAEPVKPNSPEAKKLAILSANYNNIKSYSINGLEGDDDDPAVLYPHLKSDARLFDVRHVTGRHYTTGGYSDDNPEISIFSFRCLESDYDDILSEIDDIMKS